MAVRPLAKQLQEKAIKELNEVPNRLEEDINYISEWLKKQPHLNIKTDRQWIASYLRGCKFSLEKTKEKLDFYYTLRSFSPDLFANRNPFAPIVKLAFSMSILSMLHEDEDCIVPRRCLIIVKNGDPNKIYVKDALRATLMLIEAYLRCDDKFVINEQEVIIDFKDAPLSHITQWSPELLKRAVMLTQNGYPSRLKGIHIIISPFAKAFVCTLQLFFSEKIRSRIHIYTSIESLYEIFPKESFPKEYGGNAGTLDEISDRLYQDLIEHADIFDNDSDIKVDESKRPVRARCLNELFNIEGSFRKLEID